MKAIDNDKIGLKIGSAIGCLICKPRRFCCERPRDNETQNTNQPKAFEKSRQIFVGFEFGGFRQLPAVHFC